jgi:hypothetical protein
MIISPRETTNGRPVAGARAEAPAGDPHANRLNEDEWEFLRATPDFDAEEMSSVGLPGLLPAEPRRWTLMPDEAPPIMAAPAGSPAEFPEVGSLAEMLDDLLETPRGSAGKPDASEAGWAEVPAAAEWASLMAPQEGTPAPAAAEAAPATRDVLLDALTAGEKIGLLPGAEGR